MHVHQDVVEGLQKGFGFRQFGGQRRRQRRDSHFRGGLDQCGPFQDGKHLFDKLNVAWFVGARVGIVNDFHLDRCDFQRKAFALGLARVVSHSIVGKKSHGGYNLLVSSGVECCVYCEESGAFLSKLEKFQEKKGGMICLFEWVEFFCMADTNFACPSSVDLAISHHGENPMTVHKKFRAKSWLFEKNYDVARKKPNVRQQ